MEISNTIAASLGIAPRQVVAAVELLDSGNTLPFIARYRKEVTGGLDEEQIRGIEASLEKLRSLEDRRQTILASIGEQGKLTDDLKALLLAASSKTELEDLYLPYKPRRRTRASIAREKGLEGLAQLILQQGLTGAAPEEVARPFLTNAVTSIEDALAGARDIIAEMVSDHTEIRRKVRERAFILGVLQSEAAGGGEDPRGVYRLYYDFSCRADLIRAHQILALERGEKEKVLQVHFSLPEPAWRQPIAEFFPVKKYSPLAGQLEQALADGTNRLLLPAIERDVRRALFEKAEVHAIGVFAENLRGLLTQPPLEGRVVMGIDPGFRTGSKVAVVDPTGKVLATATIYPHEPQKAWQASLQKLQGLVEMHRVSLVSIGNGTASRETELLAVDLVKLCPELKYLITSEAGASVYSASTLARSELPGLDVSLRGAISIARRVQDPLAELVKIDPKSIGVGLYQHDVDQKLLGEALARVVESVVNQVGVDLNSASPSLLTYVSGIGPKLAQAITAYRDENGPFSRRSGLRKVSGLGPKAFEQSAGFLRIRGGAEPLDASAVHPESYPVARKLIEMLGISMDQVPEAREKAVQELLKKAPIRDLAERLECGIPTLK
ncbi:MAG TPA: Tex family protein, partial [Anaerolineaceae bacterium]